MDAFAASLNLRVDASHLAPGSAERAAQLTERTNQHNACKWPITAPRLLGAAGGRTALTFDASDRFGHHGMVGLVVADAEPVVMEQPAEAGVSADGIRFKPLCAPTTVTHPWVTAPHTTHTHPPI